MNIMGFLYEWEYISLDMKVLAFINNDKDMEVILSVLAL